MGFNWDPTPGVCFGPTSVVDYQSFGAWDWSALRLIELGLITPLSAIGSDGLTPDKLAAFEPTACAGSFQVNC